MALIGEMQYLTIGGNTYSIPTGGSTVTVSRSLTSGTKTATISVDGTSYDLYAPTPNAGTVTSVSASGSGGISISGSPITSSGTISIGLNLSTAINNLGEGTSAAQRSDYIVAQYAGGGTTTTTYHRRKLENIFKALNSSDITTALGYTPYNSTNPNGYTSNTGTITSVKTTAGAHTAINVSSGAVSFNVPTKTSHLTNDAGYITSADVPEGASAYTGTISAVSTSASNGTSNGFARGDHVHNITGTTVKSALGTGSGTTKFLREDGTWATPAYTTNTDEKLQVAAVTSGTTYYPIVGTGTTAATRQYDTTGFIYKGTNGTTSAVGSAQLTLGNSTASGTANNKQGQLIIYGSTAYAHTISGAPTAARALTLPDKAGTIALTSDIPTVSYPVISVNSKTGAVSLTASDVGALASSTTYVSTITTTAGTHSAISSKSGAVSFNVPTKTSHLTNDSGFITSYTDEKLKISTATSGSSYYPLLGNGTSAATRQYDSAFQFSGTNGTASGGGGSTTLTLGNSTTSSTAGWRRGIIQLYGYGAYSTTIENRTSTDNRTIILPDNSGTVALTSDIPDVSGKIDTAGTGLSKSGTTLNHSNSVTAQTTQAVYPIKIDAQGHISGYGSAVTSMPASDVSSWAKASSKPTYTASEVGAAASTHAHGNITSGGDITATAPTIANGDQIIINDNSASKITNGPTFDGSTTTKALTPKGTWETFLKSYTETDPTVPSWAKASSKPSYTASEVGAVPTSRTVNGKALSSNITLSASDVSALYEGTLSMSGLTAYSSRCVISAGGYFKIGTMVFIQLRATNSGSLGSNNTWGYIDGFPIPTANSAAISAYASQNYGNISAIINNVGRLVIATGGSALAANTDMYFAGWYMASS